MKLLICLLLSISFCNISLAEGNSKGGDDFRNTATNYQQKAEQYKSKGKDDIAALYKRMSEIKLDAAAKADEGKWDDIDWSEYHQIEGEIAKLMNHEK